MQNCIACMQKRLLCDAGENRIFIATHKADFPPRTAFSSAPTLTRRRFFLAKPILVRKLRLARLQRTLHETKPRFLEHTKDTPEFMATLHDQARRVDNAVRALTPGQPRHFLNSV